MTKITTVTTINPLKNFLSCCFSDLSFLILFLDFAILQFVKLNFECLNLTNTHEKREQIKKILIPIYKYHKILES